MTLNKKQILAIARVSPEISYSVSLAKKLSKYSIATKKIGASYFSGQPKEYIDELIEFERLNNKNPSHERKAYIFCPAFNEESNLESLLKHYFSQKHSGVKLSDNIFEICFIINFAETGNKKEDNKNFGRFNRAIDILLKYKKNHSNINIIAKIFKKGQGSLGRARKYGMDYCLWRSLKSSANIDNSIIISNEGDTVSIPDDYISSYLKLFDHKNPFFVQGKIEYPKALTDRSEPLKFFSACRELVHNGQGINYKYFPYFDGIMPVGRNFAVSPRICFKAGGIDPISRKDTDDDMNFGTDIHILLGDRVKLICNIPLVTNPRREAMIVRDILIGRLQDSKKSYENFHKNRDIYDFSYEKIIKMSSDNILAKISSRAILCKLANQYFQWVVRSRYKANLSHVKGFKQIIKLHLDHKISYWQKEKMLGELFIKYFSEETVYKKKLQSKIIHESVDWFNKLMAPLHLKFTCAERGLKSYLK